MDGWMDRRIFSYSLLFTLFSADFSVILFFMAFGLSGDSSWF